MRHLARLFLMLGLTFAALGCSSLGVKSPTASITGMSIREVSGKGFTMNFDMDVKNPNSAAIPLSAMDYTIGIGGSKLLEGKTTLEGAVPANGQRAVSFPITMTFDSLLGVEKSVRSSGGNIPFDLDAGLSFDTGIASFGAVRTPIKYSGTIALKDILSNPRALLESDAAKKLAAMIFAHFGK